MATILECFAASRPKSSSSSSSSLLSNSPASIISASSILSIKRSLPQVNGLRIGSGSFRARSIISLSRTPINPTRSGLIVCEAQDTAVEVPSVTDAAWQSLVLESEMPVLVEFWAPWCGPCRMIHPVIDELAKQYAGKLKCYKVNTDESPSIATRYGIRSIPTVMIFKNGEKKDTVIGAVPKTTLTTSIEKFL